jgi:hypothetical protein
VKKITIAAVAVAAFAFAATASAALVPGVFDPGKTGCPVAMVKNGFLHLEKNCATSTNASAGANITGLAGLPFRSAVFTLRSASQCQGGSPRFDIVTTNGTFFLGCNNVTPVLNRDGTATYRFTARTLAAGGQQVATPTGTISSAEVLIDVQGMADITNVRVDDRIEGPMVVNHEIRIQPREDVRRENRHRMEPFEHLKRGHPTEVRDHDHHGDRDNDSGDD